MAVPQKISFANDILPILRRLSNLQWVNKGFATMYGKGCPMDFDNLAFIGKLAQKPDPITKAILMSNSGKSFATPSARPSRRWVNRSYGLTSGRGFTATPSAPFPQAGLATC